MARLSPVSILILVWHSSCLKNNMTQTWRKRRFWTAVPPWIFIGAVVVLFPIFAFMTMENINRERENSSRLLLEKGAALIRSFEAGTRTGMMGMHWDGVQLQRLLTQTAQQTDIVYLLVTDINGTILAHDDPSHIGKQHGSDLDLTRISKNQGLNWRLVKEGGGKKIFEVVQQFSPSGSGMGRPMHRNRMMLNRFFDSRLSGERSLRWTDLIIFVGLDMSSIEEAIQADIRHTIIMGVILLLIGFAGITLLFLAQSYQSTKASLSRIKAFSDNLVENMPIGLLAIDHETQIASFNHVAGSVLNLQIQDVLGAGAEEVLPDELWRLIGKPDFKRRVVDQEIECVRNDGKMIPLEVSASPLTDETGMFLGHVLLFKDLTEVRALKQEVLRSQRLASVGRLAAGVAHEIRNPLSSIKGFATYFKERYREKPEDQQISGIMIQEVDRLNKVVGQLLDLAKPVTISPKRIHMTPFIEDSLRLVENQAAEKAISIHTEIDPEMETAWIDPERINQVLLNLYLNAIESMEANGKLAVAVLPDKSGPRIGIRVSDSGSGINPEDLSHVFDPYFTTKAAGTGLGLAIVHNIIEAHNGEVHVKSQPQEGTVFMIWLPRRIEEDTE